MAKNLGKYTELDELPYGFKHGLLVVGSTMYDIDKDGHIDTSYDLFGKSIHDRVSDGRIQAGVDARTTVVVDTEGVYDEDILDDYGRLLTSEEAFNELDEEDQEDYESYFEYLTKD